MLSMRRVRAICLAVLTICLLSCVESENPVSDMDKATPDTDIYGTWCKTSEDNSKELLIIGRPLAADHKKVPAGIMHVIKIQINPKNEFGSPSEQVFFSSTIARDRYFNEFKENPIEAIPSDGKSAWNSATIRGFYIRKYRVSGGKLTIWGGSREAVAAAIESKKIKGDVKRSDDKEKSITSANITDSTANLAKYLDNGGSAALFPEDTKQTYVRMMTEPTK